MPIVNRWVKQTSSVSSLYARRKAIHRDRRILPRIILYLHLREFIVNGFTQERIVVQLKLLSMLHWTLLWKPHMVTIMSPMMIATRILAMKAKTSGRIKDQIQEVLLVIIMLESVVLQVESPRKI